MSRRSIMVENNRTEEVLLSIYEALKRRQIQKELPNQWLPINHAPYPHQVIPQDDNWDVWLLLAGRGAGKTEGAVNAVLDHLRRFGPHARVGVGAPTIADVRDTCAEGATGIITLARDEFKYYNRSLMEARHQNGGVVKFLGTEEPGRWNGPQWSMLWFDELALCKQESWDQAQFGLRLGEHPRTIATTTPKARKFVKAISLLPTTRVVRATTYDNPNLSALVKQRLEERYGGTRLGRQEIMGEFVEDIEGALWESSWIDDNRVTTAPEMRRVVVAIDPAVTANKDSDETGIAVAGIGLDGQYYLLHGLGYILSPSGWANKAIDLYDQYGADRIIGEVNNGGDMIASTIRAVRRDIPFSTIHASRGKAVRAEPIAALYEGGVVHHVGIHQYLEEQMMSFPVANEHDDMVDALVYAITELSAEHRPFQIG